jgi:hypothetical protein
MLSARSGCGTGATCLKGTAEEGGSGHVSQLYTCRHTGSGSSQTGCASGKGGEKTAAQRMRGA